MKRDRQGLTGFVFQIKRELISFNETNFDQGNTNDLPCVMVQVSDLEIASSELFVPQDSVQELLNGYHETAVEI